MHDIINEATKKDLINKSIKADKVKSYGTTRYDRRLKQSISNSISAYNKIDFNALFRADILSFKIPVNGETDNYEVELLFENICNDIKREIKANKGILEYKCLYRAINSALNRQDIFVACTCADWKYRQAYAATHDQYNGGRPEIRPSKFTNPRDTKGGGCKHVLCVLSQPYWVMRLASSIYNYIQYMKKNQEDKYKRLIYPKLYDGEYTETGDDELADNTSNNSYSPEVEEPDEEQETS